VNCGLPRRWCCCPAHTFGRPSVLPSTSANARYYLCALRSLRVLAIWLCHLGLAIWWGTHVPNIMFANMGSDFLVCTERRVERSRPSRPLRVRRLGFDVLALALARCACCSSSSQEGLPFGFATGGHRPAGRGVVPLSCRCGRPHRGPVCYFVQ